MSTLDPNSRRNRATATQTSDTDRESTTSERINRLVREVSKDSENSRVGRNNLTGAVRVSNEDAGDPLPHPQSSIDRSRHVPSWVPESAWNRRHNDRTQRQNKPLPASPTHADSQHGPKSEEANPLSPISPILSEPDPRVRRVIDELEDIDRQGEHAFCTPCTR